MFFKRLIAPSLGFAFAAAAGLSGCATSDSTNVGVEVGSAQQEITDVPHTAVERQSIGNCWLYAQATWVESMALAADPTTELDVSQSYWTYWHWFDQVTGYSPPEKIQTGGFQFRANAIVRDRGIMREIDFVEADTQSEMSARQESALSEINDALARGDFDDTSGKEAREIFDNAWGLSDEVRKELDDVFGEDGESTLRRGADVAGSKVIDPTAMQVRYTERVNGETVTRDASLVDAIVDWENVSYPASKDARREFQKRLQRALHDGQPVVITWDVDFNALENDINGREGSFNLQTLQDVGKPGRQGGHMTVLEDYAAETTQFGLLEAGVTLDSDNPDDAEKLQAALEDDTRITLLRTKNSWGADRPDREFSPGFPGYHDLWMDYLDGPIPFCPDADNPTNDTCDGETTPLRNIMLPPGY